MDKEQAIDLIVQAIDKEWTHEEIVKFMIIKLKAPPEMVERFVSQVEDQHPHPAPQPEPEPEPAPSPVQLPPWLQDEPTEESSLPVDSAASTWEPYPTDQTPNTPAVPNNLSEPSPFLQQPEPPTPETTTQELFRAKKPSPFKDPETAAEYSRFVISELRKSRKRNDVIAAICEKTGAEWGQVQRFVSQVETEHHGKIATPQTVLYLILGALFIVAGLVMIVLSFPGLVTLATVVSGQPGSLMPALNELRGTIGLLAGGFLLVMGGAIVILLTLRPTGR